MRKEGGFSILPRRAVRLGGQDHFVLEPADLRKTVFLSHLYTKRSFCQDRLGTNIEKTQKRVAFFAGTPGAATVGEDGRLRVLPGRYVVSVEGLHWKHSVAGESLEVG